MSLCGNDFVKPLPWMRCRDHGGMDLLLDCYVQALRDQNYATIVVSISKDPGKYWINKDTLLSLFIHLAKHEQKRQCRFGGHILKRLGMRQQQKRKEDEWEHILFYDISHPLHKLFRKHYLKLY